MYKKVSDHAHKASKHSFDSSLIEDKRKEGEKVHTPKGMLWCKAVATASFN